MLKKVFDCLSKKDASETTHQCAYDPDQGHPISMQLGSVHLGSPTSGMAQVPRAAHWTWVVRYCIIAYSVQIGGHFSSLLH